MMPTDSLRRSLPLDSRMRRPDGQTVFLGLSVALAAGLILYAGRFNQLGLAQNSAADSTAVAARENPYDGRQALTYLKQICALGPRPSGSPAMKQQQDLLIEHFTKLGAKVSRQTVEIRHPENGSVVPVVNLIVEWHPDRTRRRLVCAHYDTRPFPDRDRNRPRGKFIGANDGASGVSLLMELGRHMAGLPGPIGVDFVLFDGEEFVFDADRDRDYYFLGSTFFARSYASSPPAHQYESGVLLDMVADASLELYQERNSLKYARSVVDQVWSTARRLGVEAMSWVDFLSDGLKN